MNAPVAGVADAESKKESAENGERGEFQQIMEARKAERAGYSLLLQTPKSADVPELRLKSRELVDSRLAQETELRSKPELVLREYKDEWRRFFDDELRTSRQTYESLKRGDGGAPQTEEYELLNEVFDGHTGVFDSDERNALADQALEEAHLAFLEKTRSEREAHQGERMEEVKLPQQKEAVAASEERRKETSHGEFRQNPEMDAQLRDLYLSYNDAPVSDAEKERMLEFNRESPTAMKYAESLRHLAESRNLQELEEIAKEMVAEVKKTLAKLGVMISPHGESRSWALWDIAKQEYFVEHPKEHNPKYALGNIFELPQKREEIVCRQAGWELYRAYHNGNTSFAEKVKGENEKEFRILLEKAPKDNGTLSSLDLARLGEVARKL